MEKKLCLQNTYSNVTDQKLELIRSFFIPQRILHPKEHKINKKLVTF